MFALVRPRGLPRQVLLACYVPSTLAYLLHTAPADTARRYILRNSQTLVALSRGFTNPTCVPYVFNVEHYQLSSCCCVSEQAHLPLHQSEAPPPPFVCKHVVCQDV